MMSSDEKMGSRYIHARCTLIHSSTTSEMSVSVFSHSSMRPAKGPLKGEKAMDWVITIWSSKTCWMTSTPLRTKVPDSRYGITSRMTPCHSFSILSIACSMAYSLPATSQTFVTSSVCSSSLSSSMSVSVNESLAAWIMSLPSCSVSCSQWRVRIPGLRRAVMRGMFGMNSSTSALTIATISASPWVDSKVLESLYSVRWAAARSVSITSGSILLKAPENHSFFDSIHLSEVSQRPANGSKALAAFESWE
mmetsp:Transcript_21133/g.57984  ORF Transcript_21133/g.57984 Transcript_21133/m.57984 type:complete len:250 (-) Transcript_21133:367-1116(-)